MGLCKECQHKIAGKVIVTDDANRDILLILSELVHCHHDEENYWYKEWEKYKKEDPKKHDLGFEDWLEFVKKPKEKCWCDTDSSVRIPGKYVHTPRVCNMLIEYCPVCGRKL